MVCSWLLFLMTHHAHCRLTSLPWMTVVLLGTDHFSVLNICGCFLSIFIYGLEVATPVFDPFLQLPVLNEWNPDLGELILQAESFTQSKTCEQIDRGNRLPGSLVFSCMYERGCEISRRHVVASFSEWRLEACTNCIVPRYPNCF